MVSLEWCPSPPDQERTEAHEEIEAMKRKKEVEKAEEREGTVMVRWVGQDTPYCSVSMQARHSLLMEVELMIFIALYPPVI